MIERIDRSRSLESALEARVNPKLLSDVGEFPGIHETPVRHHLAQGGSPRAREEQPRNVGRPINTHQAAVNEGPGCWRQLRLAFLRAATPGPQLKALGDRWQCGEELVKLAADVL